ncbi:MAG: hypothetical protein Q8P61_01175 [Candidatus Nanopelagicales bacterium]|nr:hypothetical protein [Candidatus Nanopelagicales bacterium]
MRSILPSESTTAAIVDAAGWLGFCAGLLLILAAASSVIRTVIIARPTRSLISTSVSRGIEGLLRRIARRLSSYTARDRLLTWVAPLEIVLTLLAWLGIFLLGYGLALNAGNRLDFGASMREAGSSLFTLGFASSDRAQLTLIDFAAAATGPIVIGLMIGYLPTLYASYNRREVQVTLMHARAGEPNWGPELLMRAAMHDDLEDLPLLWISWERWAADVSESHSSYPPLIHTRSARASRHWWIALLAVMDAAALNISLRPGDPQATAKAVLRQGVECMAGLAEVERIKVPSLDGTPGELQLTFEEFTRTVDAMGTVGYRPERGVREAWTQFRKWRSNYETMAYEMAERLNAVPAPWSGPRTPPTPVIWPQRSIFHSPGE